MSWQDAGVVFALLIGLWNLVAHLRDSKRTSFINTVTSERVKWIEKTRDAISTLCGRTYYWAATQDELSSEDSNSVRKDVDRLKMLVKLQLNPSEDLSQRLFALIDDLSRFTHGSQISKLRETLNEIVEVSQQILKAEWDKVRDEATFGDLRDSGIFPRLRPNKATNNAPTAPDAAKPRQL
ncbi:MAG: hypothetical protein ACSHXZ_00665 [Gammaproteobacteria bacterium]